MTDTPSSNTPRWAARLDAYKSAKDPGFGDYLRIVAAYYELYEKGYRFMGPWISRQSGNSFPSIPPDTNTIANCIGKPRAVIHSFAYNAFVDALHKFAAQSKGRRQMINPDQSTHHSAQFPRGTFSIEKVDTQIELAGCKAGPRKSVHAIKVFGSSSTIYVIDLSLNIDELGFIIVRPKLGKLGTASAMNWEVLFYKTPHGYMIDHVDSNLNPRWSGTF